MSKLTKIETFFKDLKLSADDELFVGVDVHKKSYHIALFLNDAPAIDFVMPAKKEQLSLIQSYSVSRKKAKVIRTVIK